MFSLLELFPLQVYPVFLDEATAETCHPAHPQYSVGNHAIHGIDC